jgi:transcriptional regulator GlxA family with amidase domain
MKKNIAILLFDDVEVLDFAGPFEVFAVADRLCGHDAFHVFTVGVSPGTVRACGGLKLVPDHTLENCPPPHVLVVPGGFGTRALIKLPSVIEWVRARARAAEVVMSICTGSLVLGRAGLLDGLRVTTHHTAFALLREVAPHAVVDDTARFTDNGKFLTSAGISAGIDCSLHLVGRLLGADAAATTAHHMEYQPAL